MLRPSSLNYCVCSPGRASALFANLTTFAADPLDGAAHRFQLVARVLLALRVAGGGKGRTPESFRSSPQRLRRPTEVVLGVCALGDLAGFAGLFDDEVVGVCFYDSFELEVLVALANEEQPRMLACALVDVEIDRKLVGAVCVGAFADKRRLGGPCAGVLLEPGNAVVDLAEQGFVAGSPLLPDWHDQHEVSRYPGTGIGLSILTMAIRVLERVDAEGDRALQVRAANDAIADKAAQLRFVSRVPMRCECGDPDCRSLVMIALPDYRTIVEAADTILTASGHGADGTELLNATPGYDVRRTSRPNGNGNRRSA